MDEHSLILWIFSAICTITGLSGLLLPVVPGAPLLFLGLVLGAWADDFHYVGPGTLLVLGGMAGLTYIVEFAASVMGVRKFGGSRRGMLGAVLGGLAGFFLGIPGILIGPIAGAVIGELSQQRSLHQAGRAGFGTIVGLALGVAGKLAIGIAMIGFFLLKRFL